MCVSDSKPSIGIVSASDSQSRGISEIILKNGGKPLVIKSDKFSDDTIVHIGGLIIGELNKSGTRPYSQVKQLLANAININMPVLCVSEGIHLLNIILGGKNPQQVSEHSICGENGERISSFHHIYISPGSKLAAIVGSGGFVRVNSRHLNALSNAQKSPSLLASAYSLNDGTIEALESPDHGWIIGVQFSPEIRKEIPPHFDRLFQSLVDRSDEFINTYKQE